MCAIMGFSSDPRMTPAELGKHFGKTRSRGPDMTRIEPAGEGCLCFHRLSIMDLTEAGMQPFARDGDMVVCNGELYGFRKRKSSLEAKGYTFQSDSDCELLIPLYREYGTKMFSMLDAEFAMVLYDGKTREMIAARDPIGIRPLYYGYDEGSHIVFASEPKNLVGFCRDVRPFPPGHYYQNGQFIRYCDAAAVRQYCTGDIDAVCAGIRSRLIAAVEKRMDADAPLGFLLSGGLDSSLVCAIAARMTDKPIRTFAIGMDTDPIDLKYAREVADYIHSSHTEFTMTRDDVIAALPQVVALLGTFDITTIRASIGMYLCCKAIHEQTGVRVLMTGEVSDELFGYKYTDFAPSAEAFQAEAARRIQELHMYDVLRADRCISVNSMEARVPFADLDFVQYVMSIDPAKKLNTYGIGKYLLRRAFEKDQLLPDRILWREKAAFSDAVGHSMVDALKAYAETQCTGSLQAACAAYPTVPPFTKESLLYRRIFEQSYPGQTHLITGFWMPNPAWEGCNVKDPSARVLSNYGASGQ